MMATIEQNNTNITLTCQARYPADELWLLTFTTDIARTHLSAIAQLSLHLLFAKILQEGFVF